MYQIFFNMSTLSKHIEIASPVPVLDFEYAFRVADERAREGVGTT